jgi:predicted hydrocarbon binding protein
MGVSLTTTMPLRVLELLFGSGKLSRKQSGSAASAYASSLLWQLPLGEIDWLLEKVAAVVSNLKDTIGNRYHVACCATKGASFSRTLLMCRETQRGKTIILVQDIAGWIRLEYPVLKPRPKPLEQLSRDEENGWIMEDPERIMSFTVPNFQAIIDDLTALTSRNVANVLLFRMGLATARANVKIILSELKNEDPPKEMKLYEAFDRFVQTRGWGRCLGMAKEDEFAETVYVFKCKGTPFSYKRTASEPSCHMMRGAAHGWLEGYLGRKAAASVETECASMGAPFCVFQVTFATGAK